LPGKSKSGKNVVEVKEDFVSRFLGEKEGIKTCPEGRESFKERDC